MSRTYRYDPEAHKKKKGSRRNSETFTWIEMGFDGTQVKSVKITYVKKRRHK